jgi:hypothetical protein
VDRILAAADADPEKSAQYRLVADKLLACGNAPLPGKNPVFQRGQRGRYVGRMCHCAKALCPICLPYADAKRFERLSARAPAVIKMGLTHVLVTLTVRHHKGAKWKTLVDAKKAVWRRLGKQRFWREAVAGYYWKMESPYGKHGHHPHRHVLLSFRPGIDLGKVRERFQEYWERELRAEGRSCEWHPGWWQVLSYEQARDFIEQAEGEKLVARELDCREALAGSVDQLADQDLSGAEVDLPVVAEMQGKDLRRVLRYLTKGAVEILGGSAKSSAPWNMPVDAFVEVFTNMRHVKWFGSGGVWRTAAVEEAESEESLEQERESDDPVLVEIPRQIWNSFSYDVRFYLRCLVADESVADDVLVRGVLDLIEAASAPSDA